MRKIASLVVIILSFAILVTAIVFQCVYIPDGSLLVAHRGFNKDVLGNSSLAFIKAGELDFKVVENDIRYTKDNVIVVSHDPDVVFSDGTKKNIYESTYAELIEKPLLNNKSNDDIYLLSFIDFLNIAKTYNFYCLIEIKGSFTDVALNTMFNDIATYYDFKMCEIQSFNLSLLIHAQEIHPEYKYMLTLADEGDYHVCFEYGFDLNIRIFEVTRQIVDEFHERGLKVGVWTTDSTQGVKKFKRMRVDYILTNVVRP